jgi:hypothetical protein
MLCICFEHQPATAQSAAGNRPQRQWSYKVLEPTEILVNLETSLREAGNDGWELTAVDRRNDSVRYFFKKPKT